MKITDTELEGVKIISYGKREDNTIQLFSIDEYFHHGASGSIRFDEAEIRLQLSVSIEHISKGDWEAGRL